MMSNHLSHGWVVNLAIKPKFAGWTWNFVGIFVNSIIASIILDGLFPLLLALFAGKAFSIVEQRAFLDNCAGPIEV